MDNRMNLASPRERMFQDMYEEEQVCRRSRKEINDHCTVVRGQR